MVSCWSHHNYQDAQDAYGSNVQDDKGGNDDKADKANDKDTDPLEWLALLLEFLSNMALEDEIARTLPGIVEENNALKVQLTRLSFWFLWAGEVPLKGLKQEDYTKVEEILDGVSEHCHGKLIRRHIWCRATARCVDVCDGPVPCKLSPRV